MQGAAGWPGSGYSSEQSSGLLYGKNAAVSKCAVEPVFGLFSGVLLAVPEKYWGSRDFIPRIPWSPAHAKGPTKHVCARDARESFRTLETSGFSRRFGLPRGPPSAELEECDFCLFGEPV